MSVPEFIEHGIRTVRTPKFGTFVVHRYPYTYAYDLVRSHRAEFNVPDDVTSRSDVAAWLRSQVSEEDFERVVRRLADTYLDVYGIEHPEFC